MASWGRVMDKLCTESLQGLYEEGDKWVELAIYLIPYLQIWWDSQNTRPWRGVGGSLQQSERPWLATCPASSCYCGSFHSLRGQNSHQSEELAQDWSEKLPAAAASKQHCRAARPKEPSTMGSLLATPQK